MTLAYLRRALLNPGIYAGVALAFVLVLAAYQVRPTYTIPIGTATDGPLLDNFHGSERSPKDSGAPYATYRWTDGDASSIVFQDVGRQDFDVVLSVNGSRPLGQPAPTLRVKVGGATLLDTAPPPAVQDYSFKIPREQVAGGSFALDLEVNSFTPEGDPRELGIVVTGVKVSPSAANPDRFIEPPTGPLVAIVSVVGLLALLLALLGWGAGVTLATSGAVSLLAASLLVFDRLWLTSRQWYWTWPQSLLAGAVVAAMCWLVGGWLMERGGMRWTAWQRRALLTLVLLVFAVRLAGQLHPSIFVFDLGYHNNILLRIMSGDWVFTTRPAELGSSGHSTPYPPTPYILMLPLKWLVGDGRMAIRLLTVATGTLGALPVFYLAAKAARSGISGIIAAALYLSMPVSVIIFSWGITPNIFGEFFALCSLAVAVASYGDLSIRKPAFWGLTALLTITLLSHPGVLALSVVAFAAIPAVWWLRRKRLMLGDWKRALGLWGAFGAAVMVAIAIYYRHFVPELLELLTPGQQSTDAGAYKAPLIVGGNVHDVRFGLIQREVHNFGEWFFWGLQGFWNEAQAYYRVWPIVGAVVGYNYLSVRARTWSASAGRTGRALATAAIGWTLSVILFALAGWATNMFVRYPLFALPVIVLGCGLLLGGVWARGRAGRWLTLLVILYFAVEALAFWQVRINFAFK